MHAYSKFYRELPDLRTDFEQSMQRFLPILIDTKYIIESTPAIKTRYGTSNLDEIAPMLEREAGYYSPSSSSMATHRAQLIRHHPGFVQNASQGMHEAGYDAYMTGATFIRLLKLEGGLDLYAISSPSENTSELVLYRYINKLYQAVGDRLYWQLSGSDASRLSPANTRSSASESEGDSSADNSANNIYKSNHASAQERVCSDSSASDVRSLEKADSKVANRALVALMLLASTPSIAAAKGDSIEADVHRLRAFTLELPYIDEGFQMRNYDYGGDAIVNTMERIRLTPDLPSRMGYVWSTATLPGDYWKV
ncbi:hypothetical protein J3B02_005418, partial [Coemansia erecta]